MLWTVSFKTRDGWQFDQYHTEAEASQRAAYLTARGFRVVHISH